MIWLSWLLMLSALSTIKRYKMYKNTLRVCIRKAENNYFQTLFEDSKSSTYELWKNIGPIINPTKKKTIINKIVRDGQFISNSSEISEYMNTFFCNIGKDIQDVIPKTGDQYKNYMPDRVKRTFLLHL